MVNLSGKQVYLIGIGGCGMSGLARMLRSRGAIVRGSDAAPSGITAALIAEGIPVEPDTLSLAPSCDLLIASAAIKPDHPQVVSASHRDIPIWTYAQALGALMDSATGVALAGTHGKSTTTAMLGAALVDAGLDPSIIVGGTCRQLTRGSLGTPELHSAPALGYRVGSQTVPRGAFAGRPGLLIAEACEFKRSFHNFRPTIASISAVEADHLDVYGSLDAVVEAFHEFADRVASEGDGGRLLIAHEGAHRREVTAGVRAAVETIGFSPQADWVVRYDSAHGAVRIAHQGEDLAWWTLSIPGGHNAMNSAFAFVLGVMLGGEPRTLAESLSKFAGVDRRTQYLGERRTHDGGNVRVFDDYGHHPTEVDVTLRALREHDRPHERGGRMICVFQPHQHSRTRHLLDEFAAAFGSADVVIVPHIYFVRDSEEEKQKVTAADLVDRLRARGVRAMHLYPFGAIVEELETLCRDGDLLVVMGAGPVGEIAHAFMHAPGAVAEHAA